MRFCEADNCNQPVWGTCKISRRGYCKRHQNLREDFDPATILQKAIKKQRKNAVIKDGRALRVLAVTEPDVKANDNYGILRQWFLDRRKEMQNCCAECGKSTNMHSDKYYKWSIAHITPKALVRSVATNENNWVELCWLHHQEFDSTFDRAAAMMCFGEVKQKFQLFKHLIPAEELRKVNPHLLT